MKSSYIYLNIALSFSLLFLNFIAAKFIDKEVYNLVIYTFSCCLLLTKIALLGFNNYILIHCSERYVKLEFTYFLLVITSSVTCLLFSTYIGFTLELLAFITLFAISSCSILIDNSYWAAFLNKSVDIAKGAVFLVLIFGIQNLTFTMAIISLVLAFVTLQKISKKITIDQKLFFDRKLFLSYLNVGISGFVITFVQTYDKFLFFGAMDSYNYQRYIFATYGLVLVGIILTPLINYTSKTARQLPFGRLLIYIIILAITAFWFVFVHIFLGFSYNAFELVTVAFGLVCYTSANLKVGTYIRNSSLQRFAKQNINNVIALLPFCWILALTTSHFIESYSLALGVFWLIKSYHYSRG